MMHGTCSKCGHTSTLDLSKSAEFIGSDDFGRMAIMAVSRITGVPMNAIRGRVRGEPASLARAISILIMREDGNLTVSAVGRILGKRDHSTISRISKDFRSDHRVGTQSERAKLIMGLEPC